MAEIKLRAAVDLERTRSSVGSGGSCDGDVSSGDRVVHVIDGYGGGHRSRGVRAESDEDAAGREGRDANGGTWERLVLAGMEEDELRGRGGEQKGGGGDAGVADVERLGALHKGRYMAE